MSKVQKWRFLFEIIRYSLEGGESPVATGNINWEALYKICKFHKIESVVAHGLDKMQGKENIPQEIRKKFEQAWQLEVARDTTQQFSLEELLQAFEEAGVYCMALKGVFMKQFYPQPDLRMMADIDILFRLEQEEKVEEILTKLGYYCDHKDDHHHVYFRKPFMNIEMHYCLVDEDSRFAAYYANPWEKAVQAEGKTYVQKYGWEDFYIYVIAHFAKHFENGGSGIRSIVDIWQFEKKMKEQMNWTYVESELEKIGLKEFLHHMEQLTAIWFEGEKRNSFYEQLTEIIVGSGVYGTVENYKIQTVASADKKVWMGQMKVWISTIFFPYRLMKLQYRYLEKYPILLPVAWIQRIFRTIFKRKGKASEVLVNQKVDFDEARGRQEVFEKLGL